MLDATISLVGNLIDNPNLKVTPGGTYVCSFRIASTPRRFDRKEDRWVDSPPLFIEVTCWRKLAENVAASLNKGDRALLVGRLRLHEFENAQGERRRRYEIEADAVGPELAWNPARVVRATRGGVGERPAGQSDTGAGTGPDAGDGHDGHVLPGPGLSSDVPTAWPDGDVDGDPFAYSGATSFDELTGEISVPLSDAADRP